MDHRRLVLHRYQGLPANGYAAFTERLLEGIATVKEYDYLLRREEYLRRATPHLHRAVDEDHGFDLG